MSLYLGTTPIANDGSHNTANIDLSNLSNTGEAHFANPALTNSPYTTNRILEIPQNIKLELNNGTLTLKAGSKVYVPNGFEADGTTPKFDVENITSDISVTSSYSSVPRFLTRIDTGWDVPPVSAFYSGASAPTGSAILWWYDTANNLIKMTRDSGSTWTLGYPLPLAIVHTDGTQIVSIDQIFNGFGYIGSTTFILPGVKWQRCAQSVNYGKNADGTNASVIRSTSSVLLVNHPNTVTSTHYICVSDGGGAARYTSRGSKIVYYDESKNAWYNDYSETYVYIIPLLEEHTTEGRVDSFTPYSVDSVANSNASNFSQAGRSYLAGLGMPSGRYIDLTLGASGSTYTAPANGTFYFRKRSTAAGQYISLANPSNETYEEYFSSNSNQDFGISMNVLKGVAINANYTFGGTTHEFKFVYAEGEQNV